MTTRDFVRFALRIYAWTLFAIGAPVLCVWFYLLTSGRSRDAANSAISVLFGAFAATLALFLGQSFYDRRKKRGELLARLPALSYEAAVRISEYYRCRASDAARDRATKIAPERLELARLDGLLAEFELNWWHAFRKRRTRVAVHKLRTRISAVTDHLASPELPRFDDMTTGIDWILEQGEKAATFGAAEAGMSLALPGGIAFVHWGKVTPQDKLDLSLDDSPPPWKHHESTKA